MRHPSARTGMGPAVPPRPPTRPRASHSAPAAWRPVMNRAATRTLALGGVPLATGAALTTIVTGWAARSEQALEVGVATPASPGLLDFLRARARMTRCPDACDETTVDVLHPRDV